MTPSRTNLHNMARPSTPGRANMGQLGGARLAGWLRLRFAGCPPRGCLNGMGLARRGQPAAQGKGIRLDALDDKAFSSALLRGSTEPPL